MKTKRQLRIQMRKYLAIPQNRTKHNNWSKAYAARTYKTSKKFRKHVAKKAADWLKKQPKLARQLYADLLYLKRKQEYPHLGSMFETLKRISGAY